jgi:hypothetical protein
VAYSKKNIYIIVFFLIVASCVAPPPQQKVVEDAGAEKVYGIVETATSDTEDESAIKNKTEPAAFSVENITAAEYKETKEDIANFISSLNIIIKTKNYDTWRRHLDDDYYAYISSPEYLQKLSASGILHTQGIVLTDAYSYFMNVVVPSRSNDRVDDIEFISDNRVKAITVNRGRRLLLYDLEKTTDGWKIVMPNFKSS